MLKTCFPAKRYPGSLILQDVNIGGNWAKRSQDQSVLFTITT